MRSTYFDEDETEQFSRMPVSQIKSRIHSQKFNFEESQEFQDLIGEREKDEEVRPGISSHQG